MANLIVSKKTNPSPGQCSICLEETPKVGGFYHQAGLASHIFHKKCLQIWASTFQGANFCCPLCRDPLTKFSIQYPDQINHGVKISFVYFYKAF